jgi:hypothetical protein
MTDKWDGFPQNPERDGFHWIVWHHDDMAFVHWWDASDQTWDRYANGYRPRYHSPNYRYLGPCLTPAEVAALVEAARREEREECAAIADAGAPTQQWQDYHSEVARAETAEAERDAARAEVARLREAIEDAFIEGYEAGTEDGQDQAVSRVQGYRHTGRTCPYKAWKESAARAALAEPTP